MFWNFTSRATIGIAGSWALGESGSHLGVQRRAEPFGDLALQSAWSFLPGCGKPSLGVRQFCRQWEGFGYWQDLHSIKKRFKGEFFRLQNIHTVDSVYFGRGIAGGRCCWFCLSYTHPDIWEILALSAFGSSCLLWKLSCIDKEKK